MANTTDPLLKHQLSDTYLGFDFGNKKIGIAVGQRTTATATALTTLKNVKQAPDWQSIQRLINEWQPIALIVGISRQLNGENNPITPLMKKFCRQLEHRFQLPVYQQDETLTTYEAKQLLFDDVKVNATRLWAVQDQLAAQLILQSWLNLQIGNYSDHP